MSVFTPEAREATRRPGRGMLLEGVGLRRLARWVGSSGGGIPTADAWGARVVRRPGGGGCFWRAPGSDALQWVGSSGGGISTADAWGAWGHAPSREGGM